MTEEKNRTVTQSTVHLRIFCFKLNELVLLKMLLPLTWNNMVLFFGIFLQLLINHYFHQDIFIDS